MMYKITVFYYMTLEGFFAGQHGEIDWFKLIIKDDKFDEYIHRQSKSGNTTLIFGVT